MKTTNKSILHVLYLLIMNNTVLIIAMNAINNESQDVILQNLQLFWGCGVLVYSLCMTLNGCTSVSIDWILC